MPPRKQFTPDVIAEARRLYELTLTPTQQIAAMMGMSRTTFHQRVLQWGWQLRRSSASMLDHDGDMRNAQTVGAADIGVAPAVPAVVSEPPKDRAEVAMRILTIVGRHLDATESVLNAVGSPNRGEAERTARTLARVANSVRDLAAIYSIDEAMPPDEADDDAIPLDIDEFRNELARRIRGLIEKHRDDAAENIVGTAARIDPPRI